MGKISMIHACLELIVCFLLLFSPVYDGLALEGHDDISSLDLSLETSLIRLNKYLEEGNLLDYFNVREKLLSLSYEEVSKIHDEIEGMRTIRVWGDVIQIKNVLKKMEKLHELVNAVRATMESENTFPLKEDIYINNTPQLLDTPFCEDSSSGLHISQLKPYAEYVYFNNVKLPFKKSNVIQKTDMYFVNTKKINGTGEHASKVKTKRAFLPVQTEKSSKHAIELWSYQLQDDYCNNFFVEFRQWFKGYEENALYPVIHNSTVLMRNEYRLFCVDLLKGQELWSFSGSNNNGREYYQTYRHPHQNSFGYEMLLAENIVYTELGGKLIAVDVNDIFIPTLKWERNLGEYTLCTKPFKCNGVIIAGLINARMELWIAGFNYTDGSLLWSTYIGTNSFLSPVCTISYTKDDKIFLGTNHGVLLCLDSIDGEIIWLRKYSPKKYSLIDYWQKGYYRGVFSNVGHIKYDTQFIEAGNDGLLYYKPRESNYLCIIDRYTGELKEKILIDNDNYYILSACDGKAIFLEKAKENNKFDRLRIIELRSGTQLYDALVHKGSLQGTTYVNKEDMLFKIDDTIYSLKTHSDEISLDEITAPKDGWLLAAAHRYWFVGDKRTIYCLNEKRDIDIDSHDEHDDAFKRRKKIKIDFMRAIDTNVNDEEVEQLIQKILLKIIDSHLPLNEIFPYIVDNIETLQRPVWRQFFSELQELYKHEIVTYQNIELRFANFLSEAGFAETPSTIDKQRFMNNESEVYQNKAYNVRGEKIFLLPVTVMNGSKEIDFFLLLNHDQLLCVDEGGTICWSTKVFYNPLHPGYTLGVKDKNTDQDEGRMYADDIDAYVFNNILIINDTVNVIARDIQNGNYIWSMTNKGKSFYEEKVIPYSNQDDLFKKYGVRRSFLNAVMMHTKFINDQLIIIHGNEIYRVNPVTGYCTSYQSLDIEGVFKLAVSDGLMYILPTTLDQIKVLDGNLNVIKTFTLDFIAAKHFFPAINIVGDYIVLDDDVSVYLIHKESGMLQNKKEIGFITRQNFETYSDNLLIIEPFEKVMCYQIRDGTVLKKWEFNRESKGRKIFDEFLEEPHGLFSKYYFIFDGYILFPYSKNDTYYIAKVDMSSGKKVWEQRIDGVHGLFYNLSDYQNIDGIIHFIISTVYYGHEKKALARRLTVSHVKSTLCGLDFDDGKIIVNQELPARSVFMRGFDQINIAQTNNYFLYTLYGNFLEAKKKHI